MLKASARKPLQAMPKWTISRWTCHSPINWHQQQRTDPYLHSFYLPLGLPPNHSWKGDEKMKKSLSSWAARWAEDDDSTLPEQNMRDDQINSLRPPPIQESHSDMKPQHWARPAKILEEIQPPKIGLSIPCKYGLVGILYFFWSIPEALLVLLVKVYKWKWQNLFMGEMNLLIGDFCENLRKCQNFW